MGLHNITLIEPRAPGKHVYSLIKMPRLGLPLIGTRLKEEGYNPRLIYGSSSEIRVTDITGSDLVGISTTTSTCKEAYSIARYAHNKGIPVVMGGAHVSFVPEEALEYCDYVCRGEADFTFSELIKCLDEGKEPLEVPGVSFRKDDHIINNPLPEWVNIENSPIPDLSLFTNLNKLNTYPLITSRGCPYDCTFCCVTQMFGHRYRCRTNEQVWEEMKQYKNKNIFICDDNFAANPRRTKELLKGLQSRQILPKWWGAQVRAESARDLELLELMRDTNCGMVYIGMESINPRTLAAFNKKQTVADIENCIRTFHQYGIMIHGMFVLGGDDDTLETIDETVEFAVNTGIDTVQFLILVPLPGTPLFTQLEEEGRIITKDWNFYDGHHVVFKPRQISPVKLQQATLKAFKRFYSLKNLSKNLLVTGKKSVVLRMAGFYLIRRFEKHSNWYNGFLESSTEVNESAPGLHLRKTVEMLKFKHFKYLSTEKLVDMEISEHNGTFLIELQGYLNNFALGETLKAVRNSIPRQYKDLTININGLSFASEDVLKRFINELNKIAIKARSVKIKASFDPGMLTAIMEKYNFRIPRFDFN